MPLRTQTDLAMYVCVCVGVFDVVKGQRTFKPSSAIKRTMQSQRLQYRYSTSCCTYRYRYKYFCRYRYGIVWDKLLGKLLRGIFLIFFWMRLRSILRIHFAQQLHMKSRNHEYERVCVNYIKTQTSCTSVRPDSDSQPKGNWVSHVAKVCGNSKGVD